MIIEISYYVTISFTAHQFFISRNESKNKCLLVIYEYIKIY